jgi:hypothetical protein
MRVEFEEHPKMQAIRKYCMQDSTVLLAMVNKFFSYSYSTPFGYSFLEKPFYHSLSQMAYKMLTECYLLQPIFVNKDALSIEHEMKQGGATGTNSNVFGFGLFIDENSCYSSAMQNDMPLRYVIADRNPYEIFSPPVVITSDNYRDFIAPQNIYRLIFRFDPSCKLPCIS